MPPYRNLLILADVGAEPFHVGDEAMLAANLEILRKHEPTVRVTVAGRNAANVAERYGVTALAAPDSAILGEQRLPKALAAALDEADGLFLSGGGNLCSTWPDLLGQRILLLREARRRGLPIVTGGQTIGPELAPAEQAALAEALSGVAHLGVRELPSAALALQMGVPADRLSYQPDDAFFLTGHPPTVEELPEHPEEPFLAITLDSTFAAPSARVGLARLAAQLATIAEESGCRLAFLPHVGPLGSSGDEDGRTGAALCQLLRAGGTDCMLLPVLTTEQTVWLTQRASLVVSSRYHPLVFATAAAIPCLSISRDAYTRIKLQGALAHVGMEAWCQPAAVAEEGGLVAAFRRLWPGREEAQETMSRARRPLQLQEERRWQLLLARLGWRDEPAEPAQDLLGWPAGQMASAALAALALERQANDAETWRWRSAVSHLEKSINLAGAPRQSHGGRRQRAMQESAMITDQQWNEYARDGFLHLGKVLEPEEVEALKQRADDLALGNVKNPDVQMQLDTGGAYEALPEAVTRFDRGTMLYRKVQGLESDDLFSRLVRHPLFLEVCAHHYGQHAPVSIFRAMVMNKPAGQGTILPWHQDGGAVWALDRDPLVTIWVALDPATRANGCVEVVRGTQRLGLLSTYGSTVEEEDVERHCRPELVEPLEVEAGHAVLLHNWLIHRSGVNPSPVPRRAFTACYMDGRTQSVLTGNHFPLVAGSLPAEPYPFVHQLQQDNQALRQMRDEAERYAKSLEEALRHRASPPSMLRRLRSRLAAMW